MTYSKKLYVVIFLFAIAPTFTGCDDEGTKTSPISLVGAPTDISLDFTSNSEATVVFTQVESRQYNFKVKLTDEFGEETEFKDIIESPAEIIDIPKGRIFTVQMAGGTNTEMGEYGEATEPMLASKKEDRHNIDRKEMLKAINAARAESRTCGSDQMEAVAPLNWDDRLDDAAELHTDDMHDNNFFSHNSPTHGTDPGMRINSANYIWSTYGENIYRGGTTVDAAMSAWLKSEPHCKNIMSAKFTEVGVSNKGTYWTQVFGKER